LGGNFKVKKFLSAFSRRAGHFAGAAALCVFLFFQAAACFAQTVSPDEEWKHKRIYLGMRAGVSPRSYDAPGAGKNAISFDGSMQIAVQLNDLFAIQTELILTEDRMDSSRENEAVTAADGTPVYLFNTTYTYSSRSLIVPLLAKMTFRPGPVSLAGFSGMYFSLPITTIERHDSFHRKSEFASGGVLLGFAVGGSFGIALDDGVLFLDLRYMKDLGAVRFQGRDAYTRGMVSIGIGVEMGILGR
jgi:hypothetical protein